MIGLRDALMTNPDDPPPAAWAAAVGLITAEISAEETGDGPPMRIAPLVEGAHPLQIARAAAWIAAQLVGSLNRDRAHDLLRDIGQAAAGA